MPGLWLGRAGELGKNGVAYLLGRAATAAGVSGVHAHRFRHTFAHRWLAAVLASLWGFRLGLYLLFDRVVGKEEDGRYQALRAKCGAGPRPHP